MVNHFRQHMKRPLIGIGHSMGGTHLVNLSLLHPRLFTTLILIDPVIQRFSNANANYSPAKASTVRRDRWPNRSAAEAAFKRSKFYLKWDSRVLDKWIEHGLRELPTQLYPISDSTSTVLPAISADPSTTTVLPTEAERELTLKTTRNHEVATFLRPNFRTAEFPNPSTEPNPLTHPDVDAAVAPNSPFYRPEPLMTFTKLPFVRPSVFYVFGDESDLSAPLLRADKLAHTGSGTGGSGGVKKGRVADVLFKGVGHLIPMEITSQTADAAAGWIVPEIRRWRAIEDHGQKAWEAMPYPLRSQLSEEYKEMMLSDWVGKAKEEVSERESKL